MSDVYAIDSNGDGEFSPAEFSGEDVQSEVIVL